MLPFALVAPLARALAVTPHGAWGEPRPSRGGIHMGVDLRAAEGEPVYSASSGTVARTGYDPPVADGGGGGGRYVIVRTVHEGTAWELGYMHLARVDVRAGEAIAAGAQLGAAGSSGSSSGGAHLHFEARRLEDGQRIHVDPTASLGLAAAAGGGLFVLLAIVLWMSRERR